MSDLEYDRKTVGEIRDNLVSILKRKYGYCGVLSQTDMVLLNSGKTNIIIKIEIKGGD